MTGDTVKETPLGKKGGEGGSVWEPFGFWLGLTSFGSEDIICSVRTYYCRALAAISVRVFLNLGRFKTYNPAALAQPIHVEIRRTSQSEYVQTSVSSEPVNNRHIESRQMGRGQ